MNKQTSQARQRPELFSTRPLKLLRCSFALAALCCLMNTARAAISVPAVGSDLQTFDTLPPSGNWSYLTIAGGAGDIADATGAALDAQVRPNAASAINLPVVATGGNPPGASGVAMWASDASARFLITRPTGIRFTLLMATLQNTSGSAKSQVAISYDYTYAIEVTEQPGGWRVYYSLTGAANSWTLIPEFSDVLASGPLSATLNLGSWPNNGLLYILWADDNGSGSPDTALQLDNFAVDYPGAAIPVTITQQPTNTVAGENRPVSLSVTASGSRPITYQWHKDMVAITDATNRVFTLTNAILSDTGDYYVEISNPANTVNSSTVRLTVTSDTNGPVLVSAKGDDTYTKLFLTWNERISPDAAEEEGSYRVVAPDTTEIAVSLATLVNGSNVVLTLATPLQENTVYSVEAGFQVDLVGNPTVKVGNPIVDPTYGVVTSVRSFAITPGFSRFQAYLNRPTAETLATFVTLPEYPDGSSFDFYTNILNWPQSVPNLDQYVMRFTGVFIAPETGMHHFDPSHDDEMRLRVYPGPEPSGTPAEFAAGCCTGLTGGPTLDVDLVAGQKYYYELLVREFGGADYAGIAVTLPSSTVSSPIDSQFLAVAAFTQGASVTITQQPVNKVFTGATTEFSLDFNSHNGGFTVDTPPTQAYAGPWRYDAAAGSWREDGQGPETGHPNTSMLNSPALVVASSGNVVLTFAHRYSREVDFWDGGQVRISANGGPFTVVPNTAFSQNGYNGTVLANSTAVLAGQEAFVLDSPGVAAGTMITSVADLGAFNAGDTIRVQFIASNDGNTTGPTIPNWEITSVSSASLEFFLGSPETTVTFSAGATATNDSGANPPLAYQWFRDDGAGFVAIPGATGPTLTLTPSVSDNGAQFRVTASIPGASATSATATLTVGAGQPQINLARLANGQLVISWTGPSCLQETSTLNGAVIPWGASTVVNGVPFTPGSGNKFYRLTSTCP